MHRVFTCLGLVFVLACGGKLDPGGDGGGNGPDSGGSDAISGKDGQPSADVISPPPPPPQCTPINGSTVVSSDGSCTSTASWSCGATKYNVSCSCPSSQCSCTEESGGTGSGTIVKAPSFCPGCSSNLPAL